MFGLEILTMRYLSLLLGEEFLFEERNERGETGEKCGETVEI